MIGGYNSRKSLCLIIVVSIFASSCSIPIGHLQNPKDYKIVVGFLWFLLFGGGFVLPCTTGIMLNTVDEELRTTANSIANIWYNLLGFLPAPYAYGMIADSGGKDNKKLAMRLLMYAPVLCNLFLTVSAIFLLKDGYGTKEELAKI